MNDEHNELNGEFGPDRGFIPMDVMASIINDMVNNSALIKIFGEPVGEKLVVVADNNDLRIEIGDEIDLTEEEVETFLDVLDEVLDNHSLDGE
jgi:hypothetical protein